MKKNTSVSGTASLVPPLRASQKVRDFILEEAERQGPTVRWRMPSIRQLASHLDVSMATVQHVYKSLSNEGCVTSAAKRGSYFHPPSDNIARETLHIGLAFIWQDDARHAWESGIYAGILDASLASRHRVNFARFSPTEKGLEEVRSAHASGKLDGMIILPGQTLQPLTELCGTLGLPAAYLLPSELTSVTNFICPNVSRAAAQVANAFLDAGRRRLAFVEYAGNDNKAYYTLYRAGFIQAILERQNSLDNFVHIALDASLNSADIEKILLASPRPDAMLCGGDNMALAAIGAAEAVGVKVPEELSVVGGSGVSFHDPQLASMTRVQQPVSEISSKLFLLMESLITQPAKTQPGQYLPCGLICGNTTTPAENRLLAKAHDASLAAPHFN